jgi:hypothetical protein
VQATGNDLATTLHQPENPAATSSQSTERIVREWIAAPAPTPAPAPTQGAPAAAPRRPQTIPWDVYHPGTVRETVTRTETTLGAAHKSRADEIRAAFASMRPAQYVALGLIVLALPLFYFGWPTPALLCAATGGGLLAFAHLVVAHGQLLTILLALGITLALVVRAYNKGQLDAMLPDALDRHPNH